MKQQLLTEGYDMTLTTRVMVTSPGISPDAVFIKMRQLIGAGEQYSCWTSPDPTSDNEYRREMGPGLHMDLGQGLPALMWVDHNDGDLVSDGGHGKYCDADCSGRYDSPAGYIEINYDTAYGYRATNNASCGDLHAWLTREIGAWLTEHGATWCWYDECGDGWTHDLTSYGALGDPEVGAPGSSLRRDVPDAMRSFGALATAAVMQGVVR